MTDHEPPPPLPVHQGFMGVGEPPPQWEPPPSPSSEPHDEPRFVPWATWAVMGLCALVFWLEGQAPGGFSGARLDDLGANISIKTVQGQWWRLWSSTFMHLNVAHLVVNMVSLYNVGPALEQLLGRARLLALYAFAGLCGSLVSCIAHLHQPSVAVGASGAIFGMAAGLALLLSTWGDRGAAQGVRDAGHEMVGLLGINLVYGLMTPGIDNSAHVGGLVGGLVGMALLRSAPGKRLLASPEAWVGLWIMAVLPWLAEGYALLRFAGWL
jgi:rhomboid protease GluP